jgi:O-antigen/teichoic acid export membrane protein
MLNSLMIAFINLNSKKIVFDFFRYYLFTLISAVIGMFSITYLTNILTPSEYGFIGLYNSILYFIPALISFSVGNLQAIEIIELDEENYILFRNNYLTFLVINSIIFFLLVTLFAQTLSQYRFLTYMALSMGVLLSFTSIHNTELINKSMPTQFGVLSSITQLLVLFFSFIFLKYYKFGWEFRIYSFLLAEFLILIVRYFHLSNITKLFRLSVNKTILQNMYIFGSPLIIYTIIGWVLNQSDRFFLLHFFTLKEVGIYTVAAGLSSIIVMINVNLDKVLIPFIFTKLKKKEKGNYINKITLYYSILILILTLIYNLLLKNFSNIFLNDKYVQSLEIAYILNYSQAFFGIYTTRGLVVDYYKKNIEKTIIVGICTLALVSFMFILYPYIGYYSPAYSLLIAFILLDFLIILYSHKLLKINRIC